MDSSRKVKVTGDGMSLSQSGELFGTAAWLIWGPCKHPQSDLEIPVITSFDARLTRNYPSGSWQPHGNGRHIFD